jgi:hypothetical protein
MQLKTNYKDVEDSQGKVKFSVLKKKGKHKRDKKRKDNRQV